MDEIVHYGGEEISQAISDEFDPNAPKGSQEDVQKNRLMRKRRNSWIQTSARYRESRSKGEPGTKTITTPTTKNPLTGKSWRR